MNKRQLDKLNNLFHLYSDSSYLGYEVVNRLVTFRFTGFVNTDSVRRLNSTIKSYFLDIQKRKVLDLVKSDMDQLNNTTAKKIVFLNTPIGTELPILTISAPLK